MTLTEVQSDIDRFKGDTAALMQNYSDQLKKILNSYGGNLGDVPADPENPYHKINTKVTILNNLLATQVVRKEPHEIEAMRKKNESKR